MANRTKISTMYWEANCLPPTIILPSQISDKPISSSQTVSLTTDALDQIKEQIKELMDLDKVPPRQDQEPPQQFANPECKQPLYLKLWYSSEVEAQMKNRAPDALPGRYRNPRRHPNGASQTVASQTAASCSCDKAEPSPPEPNHKKQPTKRPQSFSLANHVSAKLWGSNECDQALYPHYESDALLRQTGDQLDSVDEAHDKLKESYVEFIRCANNKKE